MATKKADYNTEPVDLMLPLNPNNPNDDEVTVIINGQATKIQRGKVVKVPRYLYETVMNAEEQRMRGIERRRRAEKTTQKAIANRAM